MRASLPTRLRHLPAAAASPEDVSVDENEVAEMLRIVRAARRSFEAAGPAPGGAGDADVRISDKRDG